MTGPLRLAYLVHWRGGSNTGPFKKIAEHARIWPQLGVDLALFVGTSIDARDDWAGVRCVSDVESATGNLMDRLRARHRLIREVLDFQPDVCYVRHCPYYPGLERLARRRPLVVEINANDLGQSGLESRARLGFAKLTRGRLLSRAAGLVFVTNELARLPAFARYERPWVVVSNGIEVSHTPWLPPSHSDRPGLVFMGHPDSPWHGMDQLVHIARAFPEWRVEVVGPRAEEMPSVPANVTLHSVLPAAEYRAILAASDVGVGTLALYRLGTSEACALKVREYLASGLPVILGHRDTDYPDPVPFLLELPNDETGVARSLDRIGEFVTTWQGRRVARAEIADLDIWAKERRRIDFLREVAGRADPDHR